MILAHNSLNYKRHSEELKKGNNQLHQGNEQPN